MDLQMPLMDGWDAIARIRELVGRRPYILAVSAHIHGESSRRTAYDAGADDVVAKPIEPGVLVTIVRAALRTRR
jgi:DNA-binding response OmpR family regulator